jgi:DNA-binding IclR family transcriptional regulator
VASKESKAAEATNRYEAPALEKGLDILELLAGKPDGLTQVEVARALGRSVGEIFRMLASLVRRGYVAIRGPQDQHVLTLKLYELAHRNAPIDRLPAEATPIMRSLAHEIEQSCHLGIVEDGHVTVVAQVEGPGPVGFTVRLGSIFSLPSSAPGRVLLAFQDDDGRRRILARAAEEPQRSPRGVTSRTQLDRIRLRGFDEMENARIRGVRELSYPVLDPRGHALAALTVPCLRRLDVSAERELGAVRAALSRAAEELTRAIGGDRPDALRTPRRPTRRAR